MARAWHTNLSRREGQIMRVIYEKGGASAAEVLKNIPDPPSYSAVRAMLRILEEKGHLKHQKKGRCYVFLPIVPRRKASRSELRQLLRTFFDGSVERAVAALLNVSESDLSNDELDRLAQLVEQARKEGG